MCGHSSRLGSHLLLSDCRVDQTILSQGAPAVIYRYAWLLGCLASAMCQVTDPAPGSIRSHLARPSHWVTSTPAYHVLYVATGEGGSLLTRVAAETGRREVLLSFVVSRSPATRRKFSDRHLTITRPRAKPRDARLMSGQGCPPAFVCPVT